MCNQIAATFALHQMEMYIICIYIGVCCACKLRGNSRYTPAIKARGNGVPIQKQNKNGREKETQ